MSTRPTARLKAIAAATSFTFLLVLGLLSAGGLHAQFLPAVFYGTGLQAGQKVETFIDGKSCASTTATDKGEWVLKVAVEAPCQPKAGAAVTFEVDGEAASANPPAAWESGGIPTASIRTGYSLTVAGGTAGGSGGSVDAGNEDGGGGAGALVFVGLGVLLVGAAAGGFYFYRRNAVS